MPESPVKQLARLLEEAGAISVIDGIPCNEGTRRAFRIGRQAGLEAAEAKLRSMARSWPAAGSHALRVGADAIAAMAKESANGQ